jgi:2-methylcitrate dehydratase PrpD
MLVGCKLEANPSVAIGFKITDSAAEYQESIDAFEIGKTFYTCIKVKVVTDKKSTHNYKVVIEVPKTNNIEVDQTGGLEADSQIYNAEEEKTKREKELVMLKKQGASEQEVDDKRQEILGLIQKMNDLMSEQTNSIL